MALSHWFLCLVWGGSGHAQFSTNLILNWNSRNPTPVPTNRLGNQWESLSKTHRKNGVFSLKGVKAEIEKKQPPLFVTDQLSLNSLLSNYPISLPTAQIIIISLCKLPNTLPNKPVNPKIPLVKPLYLIPSMQTTHSPS